MPRTWVGQWSGGRIQRKGRAKVYVIERMVRGDRYILPLDGVESERGAERALEDFEADPVGFSRKRDEERSASGAVLDTEQLALFLSHLKTKGNSLSYRQDTHAYLGKWIVWFDGRPIRSVTPTQIVEELDERKTARRQRLIALKSYCSWLRHERHVLRTADDPTIDIAVPVPVAAKSVRRKHYEVPHVELVYQHIRFQEVRDITVLRCKSGMHQTEASRITEGKAELVAVDTGTEIAGVVAFPHKNGETHYQSLDAQAFAAAQRLAARGEPIDRRHQYSELALAAHLATAEAKKSNPKAVVAPIRPGALRHSFITWARKSGREVWPARQTGVDLKKVAATVGHKSDRTTRKFYDGTEVPMMIAVPIRLHHRDDPPIPAVGSPPVSASAVTVAVAPAP